MFDLAVEEEAWTAQIADPDALCDRVAGAIGACPGVVLPEGAQAALLLTDDARMHALNRQWRGKDKPTDVLSFPADPIDRPFLGDIAIGLGVSAADARAMGKPFADHLAHLIVHGLLHLLGHDHETEADAERMEALEVDILARLGLPDPYSLPEGA